jgi:hypothetical protein
MDWIDLAQGRDKWRALMSMLMNLRVPYSVGNFSSGCTTGSFSRRAQLRGISSVSSCLTETSRLDQPVHGV